MTQEETISYLKAYLDGDTAVGNIIPLRSVLESAIKYLSEPSLPANLDEAAEEAYPKMSRLSEPHGVIPADNKTHYLGDANEENRVAFKAGAKWMAGQGVTVKGLQYGGNLGISDIPEEFYTDKQEEVIVQIRKK